ncbi:dymeclin isoform X2 [Phalacrocorax carbo]|uniref:dymeclin isoform X2 n=1 Tax=Phalacrocorax carbo TaxID=9209 RepID=UPI0031197F65
MGANSSSISELPENEYLKKLSGAEPISENDPFWNQLLSFSFTTPTNSADLKLLEEATISVCKSLVEKNPRTGNLGSLIKVFLSRTKELKISAECQNHLFIWQAHNALFIICCLLKAFISRMSEEELQLHFTYEEKAPGSYGTECEDLIEELLCCLIQLIVEIPLLDITYSISLEAVTTLIVFLSCQLFHKEILRESIIHKYLMHGRCLPYTSRLVKTLLYNFIRQERSPPPGTHVFQQPSDGGGLLYGIASGVARRSVTNSLGRRNNQHKMELCVIEVPTSGDGRNLCCLYDEFFPGECYQQDLPKHKAEELFRSEHSLIFAFNTAGRVRSSWACAAQSPGLGGMGRGAKRDGTRGAEGKILWS